MDFDDDDKGGPGAGGVAGGGKEAVGLLAVDVVGSSSSDVSDSTVFTVFPSAGGIEADIIVTLLGSTCKTVLGGDFGTCITIVGGCDCDAFGTNFTK